MAVFYSDSFILDAQPFALRRFKLLMSQNILVEIKKKFFALERA